MHILILNIVFVFLCGGFVSLLPGNSEKKKRLFLYASFLSLWYVHSMVDVYSVPDLSAYKDYFEQSSHLTFSQSFIKGVLDSKIEIGFVVFFRLVGYLTGNFQFFLIIYSFVLLFLYYKLIDKESPFVFCSIALLLVGPYNQSIFVIRQHLALAILLVSFTFIRDRKLFKFLMLVALATFMHRSAIIFSMVYFIYGIHGKRTKGILITIAAIMILLFTVVARYVGDRIGLYQSYLETDEGQNITDVFISGVIMIASLIIMKGEVWQEGINRFSFVLIFLYFVLCVGGLGFDPTGRLSVYFSAGVVFLIPISMKYITSNFVRNIYFIIVFALYFYMVFFRSASISIKHFELIPLFG